MRVLHISDIHYGFIREPVGLGGTAEPHHDGVEKRSAHMFVGDNKPDPTILADTLAQDAGSMDPDVIVASGDIGWSGVEEDYSFALEFFQRLQASWPNAEIIIAPGNHDVNLDAGLSSEVRQDAFFGFLRSFYGEERFNQLCPFYQNRNEGLEKRESFVMFLPKDNLLIVAINSAATLNNFKGEDAIVYLKRRVFTSIEKQLEKLEVPDNALRIFVLHHHLLPFYDLAWTDTVDVNKVLERIDTSIIINSAALQTWLTKHSFDIVLHGHRHLFHGREDTLWSDRDLRDPRKLLIIGAGSTGVNESERPNQVPLSYNVIDATYVSGTKWNINISTRNILPVSGFTPYSTRESKLHRTSIGYVSSLEPRFFCSTRMDGCHRTISEDLKGLGVVSNFISIVEEPTYYHPVTVQIGDKTPTEEEVWRSFYALHPEFNSSSKEPGGWDTDERTDNTISFLPTRFRLQHGPRMFGKAHRLVGLPLKNPDEVKRFQPIHQALFRIGSGNDTYTRGYAGLYDPDVDMSENAQEPLPGLMGIQFIPRVDAATGNHYLDAVATFRNLELSFWWVVNMLEIGLLLNWAAQQDQGREYKAGRITFFSAIAEWRPDPRPMFISQIDALGIDDLFVHVAAADERNVDSIKYLINILEEKASETTHLNIDCGGLSSLTHLVSGSNKKNQVQGTKEKSIISRRLEIELRLAVSNLKGAIKTPSERRAKVNAAKANLTAAAAELKKALKTLSDEDSE
jgi:hypothetical protein